MGDDVPFYHARHVSYITSLASKLDAKNSYEGSVTEHLRMRLDFAACSVLFTFIDFSLKHYIAVD